MRWLLLTGTTVALALLMAIAVPFILAYRVRAEVRNYLRVVESLSIGTTYDVVTAQLRKAEVPISFPKDCNGKCNLLLRVDDKWLNKLHLAPLAGFAGGLGFENEKLVYKSTAMGRDTCCFVTVQESVSTTSQIRRWNDSSGQTAKILVRLSSADFTQHRKLAYAFNLACIGSLRACTTGEYLPTVSQLEQILPPEP